MKPQFLVAAPHSGAGKTTFTLAILRALSQKGLSVQPFKCGPDYLDPKLHTIAAGTKSINLDRFMMDDEHIKSLYQHYGATAEVLVTEGVMGLYDGAVKKEGSSADLALLLRIPVIMVINAKAMAYSVAAVLLGFKSLCPELHIAGVIFNFVEHESHYRILKAAVEDVGIFPLGFLPQQPAIQIASRHLGLITAGKDYDSVIDQAAAHITNHIDLDALLKITTTDFQSVPPAQTAVSKPQRRILIANDEAFNFTYEANLAALATLGQVSYFSPLQDTVLPPADLIYLPGGYPELYLKTLSANTTLLDQLYTYHKNGGRILAECGGMMYLGQYITDEEGQQYPMAGILPLGTGMQFKKLSLGYKRIEIEGITLKGHEFHYSQFTDLQQYDPDIQIWNARNERLQLPLFRKTNLLASYFHFYFGNNIKAIERLFFK
jgi:cobyrinic acid a,c-diamide synthase